MGGTAVYGGTHAQLRDMCARARAVGAVSPPGLRRVLSACMLRDRRSEGQRWSGRRQLSRVRPIGAPPCGTRPGGVDSSMLSWSRRGGVPGTHGRTSGRSSGSRQLAIRWRVEPERPQPGGRFGPPALAEGKQTIQPVRAVEMHAITVSKAECREPADRFAAACALPMRRALPVLHVPATFNFAPNEPGCLSGGMKGAPVRQRLAISGRPVGCWFGDGPVRCRPGQ